MRVNLDKLDKLVKLCYINIEKLPIPKPSYMEGFIFIGYNIFIFLTFYIYTLKNI